MEKLKKKIHEAVGLFKSGNIVKSEDMTRNLIDDNPKVPFLYNLLGLILSEQKKIKEAIDVYTKGLEIDPKYAMIYNNLGKIYFELKSIDKKKEYLKKAENYYKKSISLDKNIPEPHTNLGNLYNQLNKVDEAIKSHKNAIEANPNFYFSFSNLANVYISIGNFKEAKKCLLEAIKINPNFTIAHRLLSRIIKYHSNDKHLKELIKLYEDSKEINNSNKVHLSFALGKAYEDMANYEKSFYYYSEGNSLFRKNLNFKLSDEKNRFAQIIKTYDKNLLGKYNNIKQNKSNTIFIVGMPRSGTTLVEQILSSHSSVYGADEVEFLPSLIEKYFGNTDVNLFLQGIFDFDHKNFKNIGDEYINKLQELSNGAEVVTDKLPSNFMLIGFIKLILPNAKVIHSYRNERDNVFSIFKNHFPGGKINYAYNIDEIIDYYKLYEDLMLHWNNIFPNFIYNLKYENLINNTETEVKNLLKYCDLKWEKKCLEFYNNKRIIKTASDTQVRNKIYKTSIDSWKNYNKFLDKKFNNMKI